MINFSAHFTICILCILYMYYYVYTIYVISRITLHEILLNIKKHDLVLEEKG